MSTSERKRIHSFGHGIVSYGWRYNKLKKAMEAMLGKTEAMQKIDEHAGIRSSGGTQTLLNFGPRKGRRVAENKSVRSQN